MYRARDAKLGREVALKVVWDGFVHDPERVASAAPARDRAELDGGAEAAGADGTIENLKT